MKEPLKVGDKIIFEGPAYGHHNSSYFSEPTRATVNVVCSNGAIGITVESNQMCYDISRQQCRRLKPRVKVWPQYVPELSGPREWFRMETEDFNRLSRKQKVLLGVK